MVKYKQIGLEYAFVISAHTCWRKVGKFKCSFFKNEFIKDHQVFWLVTVRKEEIVDTYML